MCVFQDLRGVLLQVSIPFEVIKVRGILQFNNSAMTHAEFVLCLSVSLALQPRTASVHSFSH